MKLRSLRGTVLSLAAAALSLVAYADNIPNPVIEHVADAGCFRWAGRYYLGGVATYGDFYVSDDLVAWPERVHVFDLDNDWTHGSGAKNNQVHADDILYRDGRFHLLFSVNYWGDDHHAVHITHAEADAPTANYVERRSDQWMENRIDPQVFIDDDGSMYLYMVKFTDGNVIWARPLADDFSFSGDAMQMFASQPGTWETMDNRVAEGPFVIKYRGRYYMMYNANHTSPRFGNYRLGVCEAADPMSFNPALKYSWPVVAPETDRLSETFTDLITFGAGDFNPVNLAADTVSFALSAIPANPYIKVGQHGNAILSLNGHRINPDEASGYAVYRVDPSWLVAGDNTIEISRPSKRTDVVALALYDSPDDISGTLMLTPGQPNIVRGPNGWEWWLVYMANEGWSRHQYIDRVHFTDARLAVDGITGRNAKGIHPVPAKPSMTDPADIARILAAPAYLLEAVADVIPANLPAGRAADLRAPHSFRIEKDGNNISVWVDNILTADFVPLTKEMKSAMQTLLSDPSLQYAQLTEGFDRYGHRFAEWGNLSADENGLALAPGTYLHAAKLPAYEVSANLRNLPLDDPDASAGLVLAWRDKNNYVTAMVNPADGRLIVESRTKGKSTVKSYPLAETFVCYPDLKNTDMREKQYRFDRMTRISAIHLPTLDAELDPYARDLGIDTGKRGYHPDMADLFEIQYLDGRTWRNLPMGEIISEPDRCTIPTDVTTHAIRFINRAPRDNNRHLYKIQADRRAKDGYQIRARRHDDVIDIFVDNRHVATVTAPSGDTQIGLRADGPATPLVSDMLLYRVN